jgi:hypothetical protein
MSERPNPGSWSKKDGESRDTRGYTDLHFGNLFDQDEDGAGETTDLATAHNIKTRDSLSQEMEGAGIHVVDMNGYEEYPEWHDVLPPLDDEELPEEIRLWAELYQEEIDQLGKDEDAPKY